MAEESEEVRYSGEIFCVQYIPNTSPKGKGKGLASYSPSAKRQWAFKKNPSRTQPLSLELEITRTGF
jgi:hypothetical protein